jgi:hypothetical protein
VTKDKTGLFGLGKEKMADVVLIPGLKVDVDGTSGENGQVVAKTITVDGDDLETSEMIKAGLHPTAQQVAANVQKLEEHEAEIAGLKAQLAGQQQNIAACEKEITEDAKDSEPYTEHFMASSDYDEKAKQPCISVPVAPRSRRRTRKNSRSWRKPPLIRRDTSSR